ncbi:hypothetical protein HPP92_019048 [Vanilla planifolia]|uniref:Uncharacterized protein n=1 Tax=Vanilla planifolia TaxID=51239 RepID=A0A835Q3C3_VANPL|nr:hypothetical protein HPP92_019048 [Vanilla planifolia]
MDSHTQALLQGRRLSEFLEEQQEPFLLEYFLLENGCSCKVLKCHAAMTCWPRDGCKKILSFDGRGLKRRGVCRVSCVLKKLMHSKLFRKILNWNSRRANKVWGCLHCVRIVEEENPSTTSLDTELSEQTLYSACFCNLHEHTESNKALFQPKQLIFHCINEVEGRILNWHESLGQGRVFSLEKQRNDANGIAQLMDGDLSVPQKQWNHFQSETRAIGTEIEGFIFEKIREEAVAEMLDFIAPCRKIDSAVCCVA